MSQIKNIEQLIEDYMQTIARLYGLSEEHGAAMWIMLKHAQTQNNALIVDTSMWRNSFNNEYGWKTAKPSTRVLRELEEAGLITRHDRYCYELDKTVFGDEAWYLITNLRVVVDYDENGLNLTIDREYSHWNEEMEDEGDEQ